MPSSVLKKNAAIHTYATLRKQVRETFVLAVKRIELERLRAYSETGRLIQTYLRIHKDRAAYGNTVIPRLAQDLDLDPSVLSRTIKFYLYFPDFARWQNLIWSHYRQLITVKNEPVRSNFACRANSEHWTAEQLAGEIKRFKAYSLPDDSAGPKALKNRILKPPPLGPFYHYRILEVQSSEHPHPQLYLDLGFGQHVRTERFELTRAAPGDILGSEKDGTGSYRLRKITGFSPKRLFTYQAYTIRVIDGDTVWMHIDMGFGSRKKVKIRLRGINTPEITTRKGRRAKELLQKILDQSPRLTLKSTRQGKYDRFLGDLFTGRGEYINQRMIDAGFDQTFKIR